MEFVLTTDEKLEEILNRCLANRKPDPAPEPVQAPKLLFSIKALSDFLDCSPVTAQKLKNSGKIRYRQFGRKCVFNTIEIMEDLGRKR